MAQTGFSKILTYKSDTATSVPAAGDLTNSAGGAELAVYTADKRLFTKDSGGNVVELGTNPSSITLPNGTANGVVYANGSKVLTTGSALVFDGANLGLGMTPVYAFDLTVGASNGIRLNASSGQCNIFLQQGGVTNGTINAGGGAGTDLTITGARNLSLVSQGTGTVNGIIFSANNSEQMRLTSTGLGNGTSSPGAAFGSGKTLEATGPIISGGSLAAHQTSKGVLQYDSNVTSIRSYGSTSGSGQIAFRVGGGGGSTDFETMPLDSSGNLGLGVTPSAATTATLQLPSNTTISGVDAACFAHNAIFNTGWKYITTAGASLYQGYLGNHYWYTAPSGTAGNAISFTQAMTLDYSGNLGIGTSAPLQRLTAWTGGTLPSLINNCQLLVGDTSGFANAGLALVANAANASSVTFGSTATPALGRIEYDNTNNYMRFLTNTAERMRIDSSGNVGIGTSAPTGKLDVAISSGGLVQQLSGTSGVYTRLGTASSSFYTVHNGTTDTFIYTQESSALRFGTAATERMRIDSSGSVLINSPTAFLNSGTKFQAYGGALPAIEASSDAALTDVIGTWNRATSGNNQFLSFYTEASPSRRGSITYNRGAGLVAYNTTSDYRLKENVVDLPNALETVLQLQPRQFAWKETGNTTTGFIAHELANILPHAVSGEKDAVDKDGKPVYQGIDTSFLVATLTKAIQEQQELINQLTARVAQLEGA